VVTSGTALGPKQPVAWLFVSASPSAVPGAYSCRVRGKSTGKNQEIAADASVSAAVIQELAGLPYPPPDLTHQVGFAVTPKPPFALTAKFAMPEVIRGGTVPLTIAAVRIPGFDEEIALSAVGVPATLTAALKNIPKAKNEVTVDVRAAGNAPLGHLLFSFAGTAKVKNNEYRNLAQPVGLNLTLPFDLRVEGGDLELSPGKKATVRILVTRRGGYKGPISLEARNLPAKLSAGRVTVSPGQSVAQIEVSAAADAAACNKTDVSVLGVATAAKGQQNSSPNFAIRVTKKETFSRDAKSTKK